MTMSRSESRMYRKTDGRRDAEYEPNMSKQRDVDAESCLVCCGLERVAPGEM